jgi:ubiquinone/menaquinone biosynthesis C-methylase UbiE
MLQRALAEAPGLPLLRADVARLPFAHASLAGAHAGAALHMWPDPDAAIAEVGRVLRPGGVFVASTFAHREPLRPLTTAFQAASSARVFEVEELAGMCRTHGLRQFTAERRGALVMFAATRA